MMVLQGARITLAADEPPGCHPASPPQGVGLLTEGRNGGVAAARELVEGHPFWYHTMELAPGVVTPGQFDLRPIVDSLPWPPVAGLRCLDVGPYDGFLSFELERRGAAEVIAADIGRHEDWDWPPDMRNRGGRDYALYTGTRKAGVGFEIAKKLLGSSVQRIEMSAYDLSEDRIGAFDVVVCGSLMLHLRDPLRALEAIRGVCRGYLLSAEEVRLGLSFLHRQMPLAQLNGSGELCQWWIPNVAGHRRMVFAAGFAIQQTAGPYANPFGISHGRLGRSPSALRKRLLTRLWTGRQGIPHSALLARPRV
jgi:tRNA (mo5U34)-methyltransferase